MRFILAALALLIPVVGYATTVRKAELDELVRESHMVVRGHVAFVDERAGEQAGKFQTRIGFEITEVVKGLESGAQTYELVLPGGRVGPMTSLVAGVPTFTPGQEVVLLIKHTRAGDAITGLTQGVFNVDRSRGVARARRLDLGDVRLVDRVGRETTPQLIDTPLSELMLNLRVLSARGEQ